MLSCSWKLVALGLGLFIFFLPMQSKAADRDPTEAFQVMANAGIAYLNDSGDCPGVINAGYLIDSLVYFTVIDIRSRDDYLAGHIPGALHSSLGTLIDDLANTIPSDKPYVVTDYSGQTSSQAKMAMELLGYNDAYCLLYGMSAWNTSLDVWTANCSDDLSNPETVNQNGNLIEHEFPNLEGDPGTIVTQRVAATLAAGFKGVNYLDIEDNLDDYFIINYFGEADYEGMGNAGVPGHIPGAFQFTPYASMGMDQMLNNIPTDQPVVVYDWTGHHSIQVVSYLNMLGYEAYSLKFGANALFYSSLTAHKWSPAAMNDFPLEVGDPTEAFQIMAASGADYINNSADCPGHIPAVVLNDNLELYTVIDLRSENNYLEGHIPGAFHSSLGTLIDDLTSTIPSDKPYVVAGYTGQVSSQAKMAMELLGYNDVKNLLFGMSAWNTALDVWTYNCSDDLANPETENQNGNLIEHDFPNLEGDPETIVAQRVAATLAAGFKGVSYAQIADHLEDYFIINYFGEADYLGEGTGGVPGHIPGAFQFTPYASMGMDQMLNNIPTDQLIVVYGWTGQFSIQIVSYLNMLGYEAYSLKFGANSLFYSELLTHKWTTSAMNDFPLEVGNNPAAVPEADRSLVTFLGNHPNPFNPSTTISYRLSESAPTTLRIFDLAGRLVRTLVNAEDQSAERHEFTWRGQNDNGQTVPSGTYIYRLDAGKYAESRRLMLLK